MIGDAPHNDPRSKAASFFANVTGFLPIPVVYAPFEERIQALGFMHMVGVRPDGKSENIVQPLTIQMRFSAIDWL